MRYQYVVEINALAEYKRVKFEVAGTAIILIRIQNQVRAFQRQCLHAGAKFEKEGVCEGRRVCPWYNAEFDIRKGQWVAPLPLTSRKPYPVFIEQNHVRYATGETVA